MKILLILAFILAIFFIYILPGFIALGLLKVKLKLAEKIAVAFILGSVISSLLIFLNSLFFQWSAMQLWFLVIIYNLILVGLHLKFIGPIAVCNKTETDSLSPTSSYHRRFIWLIALTIGFIFLIGAFEFRDQVGTWHTTVIGDNDKHFAMVVSMINSKRFPVPIATSSLFEPVLVSYYYFYYLLIAAVITMSGNVFMVANSFALISSLNLIAGFILIPLTAASLLPGKRTAFFVSFLPLIAGFQIIPLVNTYFTGKLNPFITLNDDMSALPIVAAPHAIGWVPQHLAGLFTFALIIFILRQTEYRLLKYVLLGSTTAILAATSFFIFAAFALSGFLYLFYLLIKKSFKQSLLPLMLFGISFLLVFSLTSKAIFSGVEEKYFGDMFAFLLRDPVLKNEIFGVKHISIGFFGRILWTCLYYFERIGIILPLGIVGLIIFRKIIFQKIDLALLVITGLATQIITLILFLPGEQNEFSKYGSLLYLLMYAILAAATLDYFFNWSEIYLAKNSEQLKKFKYFLRSFLLKATWLAIGIIIFFNLASAFWAYYFGILDIKIKHSADPPRNQLAQATEWIRKNTDQGEIFSIHPQFATLVISYGERRVIVSSKLGAFTTTSQKQYREFEETVASLMRFDANGYNQAAYEYLQEHRVKYLVTAVFDSTFANRKQKVDPSLFQQVYEDENSAIYRLN